MRRQPLLQTLLAALVLSGCGIVRESKYQFTDGVYDSKLYNKNSSKVYVESKEEAICILNKEVEWTVRFRLFHC